jgi:hypothetical protein
MVDAGTMDRGFTALVLAVSFVMHAEFVSKIFKLAFWIIWGELYENYHYMTDFSFELRIIKVVELTR